MIPGRSTRHRRRWSCTRCENRQKMRSVCLCKRPRGTRTGAGLRTEPSRGGGCGEGRARGRGTSLSTVWLTSQRILARPTSHIPALRVTAPVRTVTATQDSVRPPPAALPLAARSRDVSIPSAQRAAVFDLSIFKERAHVKRSFVQTHRAPSHLHVPCKC